MSGNGDHPVRAELTAVRVEDCVLIEHAGAFGREPAACGGGGDALLQEREIRLALSGGDTAVQDGGVDRCPKVRRTDDRRKDVVQDDAPQTPGGRNTGSTVGREKI